MEKREKKRRIVYVPNILSIIRIGLIPWFVWLYFANDFIGTATVLFLSGLSDIADGIIARRFDAITNIGKILDPIADKLTQLAMLICLVTKFPLMLFPCILLVVKELAMGITGLIAVKKTGIVKGADWHGKVNTCLLYAVMLIHILWSAIPPLLSDILIFMNVAMMLLSFVLYIIKNIKMIIK